MNDLWRERFKETVYDLLSDDDSNFWANMIIDAADEYAEDAVKEALIDKDIDAPSKSALDHIHNVVAENAFNKGYDAGYKEGYERGKADAAISASTLAKQLMEKFDDVLSVADVLEELEMVEKGEGYEQGKKDAAPEWIPVSERMPKKEDCPMDCLVTRKSKTIGNYTDMAVAEKNGTWTHEDWEAIVLGDNVSGKKTGLLNTRGDEIVAWMPQVEPWKGE